MEIKKPIPCNSSNYATCKSRTIEFIVVHYTGNVRDSALANCKYYNGPNREASAHYFVDDNSILQSVDDKDKAWHCGAKRYKHPQCRNQNSIGIEMCTSGNYIVSQKTIENTIELVVYLCKKYGLDDSRVVRHYDVTGKKCPAQFVDDEQQWKDFLQKIHEKMSYMPTRPLKKGCKGEDVKWLQETLNQFGYQLEVDGSFGNLTDKAVRDFQKNHGLEVDGSVWKLTIEAMRVCKK